MLLSFQFQALNRRLQRQGLATQLLQELQQTVLTTTRVALGHPTATIPQQSAFDNSARVIHQPPIPSTKAAIPTAGPSYPTTLLAGLGAAVLTTTRVATGSSTATIPHYNAPVISIPSTKPAITTAGPSYPTTPRVATGSSMAMIPHHNAPVVSIPSTKPVIPTAGPSYPTNPLAGLLEAVNNTPPVNTKVSSIHALSKITLF